MLDLANEPRYPFVVRSFLPMKAPNPRRSQVDEGSGFRLHLNKQGKHRMNTTSAAISQSENDERRIEFRRVRSLASLDEADAVRFLNIVAPNPERFVGTWSKTSTPTLYGEFVDSSGCRKWDVLRDVDSRDALATHVEAGKVQEPIDVPKCAQGPIRAVALRYAHDTVVSYFSIDVDGGYDPKTVAMSLSKTFGPDAVLLHSGSGKKGRYRVLGRLALPMTVDALQAHLRVVCAWLGFPVKSGHLEISPGNAPSRLPFGCGGCTIFSTDLAPVAEGFDAAISAFVNLVPVDLHAVVERIGSGIDTGSHRIAKGRIDPWTRRERPRSRPRRIRRLLAEGITGHGQRNRAIFDFVRDSCFSGFTCAQTIARLVAWIEAGKLDASRDAKKNGRAWLIKHAKQSAVRIYATLRPLGIPDPMALTSEEIADVKSIAQNLARRSEFSALRIERFLLRVLPWFKGARCARLSMLRMHCKKWESFDREYAALRALTGLFDAKTGYRSLASVRERRSLGARDSEAYARSYGCSFSFRLSSSMRSSYALSSSQRTDFTKIDLSVDPPTTFVCNSLPSSSSLPSVSSPFPTAQTRTPQLYVPQSPISLKTSGSVNEIPMVETEFAESKASSDVVPSPIVSSESSVKKRRKRSAVVVPLKDRPEWQRIARWTLPAGDMGLDEWFEADAAIRKEYAKERRDAIADRDALERQHGIRVSIGRMASPRFHELRALFGLDSWE